MKEYLTIGKIVNTHGIKGEIRIKSYPELPLEKIYQKKMRVYLGANKDEFIILGHRIHKNLDMITFEGVDNINEVLKYKGEPIFIKRSDLQLENDFILEDLIGFKVKSNNKEYGLIRDYQNNNGNIVIEVNGSKKFYIPYIDKYIKKIDLENKEIIVSEVEELIL